MCWVSDLWVTAMAVDVSLTILRAHFCSGEIQIRNVEMQPAKSFLTCSSEIFVSLPDFFACYIQSLQKSTNIGIWAAHDRTCTH